MTSRHAVIVTICFGLLLVAPVSSAFIVPASEQVENRRLFPFPDFDFESVVTGEVVGEMRRYVADHMSARTFGIRTASLIDFEFFGQSPNPSVLVGREGWLFHSDGFLNACSEGAPDVEVVMQNLRPALAALRREGVDVSFTIAPSKRSIYPEQQTELLKEFGKCAEGKTQELRDRLAASGAGYIDLWGIFFEAKPQSPIYFRTDTHFNYEGAALWFEGILEALQSNERPAWWREPGSHIGNLTKIMGLPTAENTTIVYLSDLTPAERIWVDDNRFDVDEWASEMYSNPRPAYRIAQRGLILKDSFVDISKDWFTQLFDKTLFTDFRDHDSWQTFADHVEWADVVIIETADHELWTRFSTSLLSDLINQS